MIDNHEELAIERLIHQYKNKPRIEALIRSYAGRCQELESVLWDVLTKRLIDNASNAQLDVLGKIVGQARRGQTDDEFRRFIAARIRTNLSHGHPEDLIAVFQLLTSSGRAFALSERYPVTVVLDDREPIDYAENVLEMLAAAKPAGVSMFVLTSSHVESENLVTVDVSSGNRPAGDALRGVIDATGAGTTGKSKKVIRL